MPAPAAAATVYEYGVNLVDNIIFLLLYISYYISLRVYVLIATKSIFPLSSSSW